MNENKLRDDYWAAWRELIKIYNSLIEELERLGGYKLIEQVKKLDSSFEKLREAEIMLVRNNVNLNDKK